jgi:hypothetical protein
MASGVETEGPCLTLNVCEDGLQSRQVGEKSPIYSFGATRKDSCWYSCTAVVLVTWFNVM